jgi:hypothetical protein
LSEGWFDVVREAGAIREKMWRITGLDTRTINCLMNEAPHLTPHDPASAFPDGETLMKWPNFGHKSLNDLLSYMAKRDGVESPPEPKRTPCPHCGLIAPGASPKTAAVMRWNAFRARVK